MICTTAFAIAKRKKNSSFPSPRRLVAIRVKNRARQHPISSLIPTRSVSEAAIQLGPFDLPIQFEFVTDDAELPNVFSAILVAFSPPVQIAAPPMPLAFGAALTSHSQSTQRPPRCFPGRGFNSRRLHFSFDSASTSASKVTAPSTAESFCVCTGLITCRSSAFGDVQHHHRWKRRDKANPR